MWEKIRKFEYSSGKFVKLHFKEPFVAMANGISIKIDEYFDRFLPSEQKVIIWHELYHYKYNGTRFPLLWLKNIFKKSKYNASQLLEFEADEYSAKNNGKKIALKTLNKVKSLIDKKILPQSLKDHPRIEERIKRIKELK